MKSLLEKILKYLATKIIQKYHPDVVGVTGSVGKTSTKEAIATVLASQFKVRQNIKNYNNELGVPLTIIGSEDGGRSIFKWLLVIFKALKLIWFKFGDYPQILILEMGADKPGDIRYLLQIAPCNVGVLTAVSATHTEAFGSIEQVKKEKEKIITQLKQDGFAIYNYDEENLRDLKDKTWAKVISYGFDQGAEVKGGDLFFSVHSQIWGTSLKVGYLGSNVPIFLPNSLGKSAAYAALAGVSVGLAYKMNLLKIAESFKNYNSPRGRLKLIPGIKNTLIIDDTYNSSPKAAKMALDLLGQINYQELNRKIVVLGDMLELGKLSESSHREIGFKVAEEGINYLITLGPEAVQIATAAIEAGMNPKYVKSFDNKNDLAKCGIYLQELIMPNDLILIKGSQGMRMEKIVKEVMAEPLRAGELLVRQDGKWA